AAGDVASGSGSEGEGAGGSQGDDGDGQPPPVQIDLEGIARRVVAFPVPEARYSQVVGLGTKVLLYSTEVEGELTEPPFGEEYVPPGLLEAYDLTELEAKTLAEDVGPVTVSADRSTMAYRVRDRWRVLAAGAEPDKDAPDEPGRRSGWLDLGRVRVAIEPAAEWRQMLAEAWRLQRDQFWVADMSGVDWAGTFARYEPLAARLATRSELSDLMWELQGELGTSHAYEIGGDYRPTREWVMGHLGADLSRDRARRRWRIDHLVVGDSWDPEATSPLTGPGINVAVGDTVLAVNGQPVPPGAGPWPLLLHQGGQAVELTVGDPDGRHPRRVVVKALADDRPARYREWVETNRARVHRDSGDRLGYIHVPDMVSTGFAEFHRSYLAELDREALVVDVRFNRGGQVSGLLLQRLARRRLGYDVSRWLPPEPYPPESPTGPMVCLTNEHAGSDGDIFTHGFSMLGLGPVIGTRTWGGVIGIDDHLRLVDGTLTTQPEFSFWFADVGFGIENHGAEPDVERDIAPHEAAAGQDPQLEAAIEAALAAADAHHPPEPDLETRARLGPVRPPA
ncbi:MAG: PDZ domain-containing protein, partial [Acidimicrobiales bacterium]